MNGFNTSEKANSELKAPVAFQRCALPLAPFMEFFNHNLNNMLLLLHTQKKTLRF